MHIISGSSVDVDDGDLALYEMKLRDTHQLQETHTGACEDDCESTAPFIGMLPDESHKEDGSILDFGYRAAYDAEIKRQIETCLQLGWFHPGQ